jgi:hypothetical protein
MELTNMTTTSESVDAKKAVANGHVFSEQYIDQQGRMILRPIADETVDEALRMMMKICSNALDKGGRNWKSVIQDNDKYHVLTESCHKKKIVLKVRPSLSNQW